MLLHGVTAGRVLVEAWWPGTVSPHAPRIACVWGIIDRASITDASALERLEDLDPHVPARDSVAVETLWTLLTKKEREIMTRAHVYDGMACAVMELGDDRNVDAGKLAMLLAVSPADQLAWVEGVQAPRGEARGVLGLRGGKPVWFLNGGQV